MGERPKLLTVALRGSLVGRIVERAGRVELTYDADIVEALPSRVPLLSCSLPVQSPPADATAFFDGLLPEGSHRHTLAATAGVSSQDTFGLLARYGRDVAGAVCVADPEREPREVGPSAEPLDDDALAAEVAELPERPLGIHDDSELSLAGIQDKMLLVDLGAGRWGRPRGGMPSTHILKVDHRYYRGVVAAEADGLSLARSAGLTTVAAELRTIADVDCLIVSRFDRVIEADGTVSRVHQEDTCQALGRPPQRKYEVRQGGGGPEFSDIAELLDRHGGEGALAEMDRLAAVAAFTAVIGNADGHGKNIALSHPSPGRVALAPLYDQVPTILWPQLSGDAAMTVAGRVDLDLVGLPAIREEAKLWRHDPRRAADAARRAIEAVRDATLDGTIDPQGRVAHLVLPRAEAFLTS